MAGYGAEAVLDGLTDADADVAALSALPEAVVAALGQPYSVTPVQKAQFRERGFLKVEALLPPALILVLGEAIRGPTAATHGRSRCTSAAPTIVPLSRSVACG